MGTKYRIPYRMFFQWFVPFNPVGAFAIAVLGPVAVALSYYALFVRPDWNLSPLLKIFFWLPWGLSVFVSPVVIPAAAVLLFAYHRPATRKQALVVGLVAWLVGGLIIAGVTLREPQTLLWSLVACLPLTVVASLLAHEASEVRHLRVSPRSE